MDWILAAVPWGLVALAFLTVSRRGGMTERWEVRCPGAHLAPEQLSEPDGHSRE